MVKEKCLALCPAMTYVYHYTEHNAHEREQKAKARTRLLNGGRAMPGTMSALWYVGCKTQHARQRNTNDTTTGHCCVRGGPEYHQWMSFPTLSIRDLIL